jgi:hypothetical protein
MARIRTIKPEFPQSESMGRISRDARLLFIELWTLCDDSGRTRAASRMLASLLFPYDDDAPSLIDGWLAELEREDCIVLYSIGGATYLQICNWLNHQKIDKPSGSKIPEFDESSRIFAKDREPSCLDQGSRIKDQGPLSRPVASDVDDCSRVSPVPVHDGFEEFYQAYPRHEAKQDAAKAWKQIKPDLSTLLLDIENRVSSGHWADPKFIPLPATYLRGKRWTDAITPRKSRAAIAVLEGTRGRTLTDDLSDRSWA